MIKNESFGDRKRAGYTLGKCSLDHINSVAKCDEGQNNNEEVDDAPSVPAHNRIKITGIGDKWVILMLPGVHLCHMES